MQSACTAIQTYRPSISLKMYVNQLNGRVMITQQQYDDTIDIYRLMGT